MDHKRHYLRFAAMIATSMIVMYALMYLNTYALQHVRWSETRLYMTLIMGAGMAIVMLAYMWGMYRNLTANLAIIAGSIGALVLALWLVRSQATVDDRDYMEAMIPHHSIAILTSENAAIDDVRVRELADEIVRAQRREISEMEWLIDDIRAYGPAMTETAAAQRPVPQFQAHLDAPD